MLKKLSDEQILTILETGIAEFADNGPDRANISEIARKAGVSVGVIYKYYGNKEGLFEACLDRGLSVLEGVIGDALSGEEKILVRAKKLILAIQRSAKAQPAYSVLYHEVTAGSCRKYAPMLARKIESISAAAYTGFLVKAQEDGGVRRDMDPGLFAFFFDSMLMMLQFSYCCDYYKERFRIYCGENAPEQDERVAAELLKFFESAFTTERAQIAHQSEGECRR